MIIYRGDDRKPSEIARDGFRPKNYPRTGTETWARQAIKDLYARNPMEIEGHVRFNPGDCVSTDLDVSGQANERGKYVYKIEFPVLPSSADYARLGIELPKGKLNPQTGKVFQIRPNALWPILYLNRPVLDLATVIALQVRRMATEVTFFTSIPKEYIVAYRQSPKESWKALV